MTVAPRASAGRISCSTCWARDGRVERRLGPRGDVAAVEDEVADLLAERRAARLAREDDLDALGLEAGAEQARLGGLAGAVEPFEGDEHLRVDYGDAGARHRRCRVHRLARRRGAARARRRGARRRRPLEGQARATCRPRRRCTSTTSASRSTRIVARDGRRRRSSTSRRRPTCASRSPSPRSTPRSTSSAP